jgi:lipoyl(octanoyl) transferase
MVKFNAMMDILIRPLGRVDYLATLQAMRTFTDARTAATPDEIWLVEHAPVYTQGQAGKPEHLLQATDIPVVQTERGGQITYHGPGQVVAYLLVDLKRRNIKVRELVRAIEDAVIATLAAYNLAGVRKAGAPGIYVDVGTEVGAEVGSELQKIAALGLKIRNHCSYHGVSLNVQMDLVPFDSINACGYPGLKTTDMATQGSVADPDQVARRLAEALLAQIEPMTQIELGPVPSPGMTQQENA